MNMEEFVRRGREFEDTTEYDEDGVEIRYRPEAGSRLPVEVIAVSYKEKNGNKRWGVKLKVLEGDDQGKTFWTDLAFMVNNDRVTSTTLASMEALGLDLEDVAASSEEDVKAALKGLSAIIIVGYRPNEGNPDNPWDDHRFVAKKTKAKRAPAKKKAPAKKAPAKQEDFDPEDEIDLNEEMEN